LFQVSSSPPAWHPACKISPKLDNSVWESWLKDVGKDNDDTTFLTPAEVAYVIEISKLLCLLDKEELRAIGTHYSPDVTCEDIRFNLRHWRNHYDLIISGLKADATRFSRSADKIVTTSREVLRKSHSNRQAYNRAYLIISDSVTSPEIKHVFTEVQRPDYKIWLNDEIKQFAVVAPNFVDVSIYTRRGLAELGLCRKLVDREKKESEEAFERLTTTFGFICDTLNGYRQITLPNRYQWVAKLETFKGKLFEITPRIDEKRDLGVDDF
jgi:hypothetical protein